MPFFSYIWPILIPSLYCPFCPFSDLPGPLYFGVSFLALIHPVFVHRSCTLCLRSHDLQLVILLAISCKHLSGIAATLYISHSAPKREGRLTRFSRSDKNTVKYVRLYSSHLVHMRVPQGRIRVPRLPPVSPQ